jgi:transcriptional regulator GlxA family with amidase domain
MEAHYGEPIKISDLAAAVHVSPQYLSRTFKRFINQSPGQYLLGLRINRAKTLLVSQKHLMISAVADAVGIPDQAYFSNVFKRETGVTPLNYRKWQH